MGVIKPTRRGFIKTASAAGAYVALGVSGAPSRLLAVSPEVTADALVMGYAGEWYTLDDPRLRAFAMQALDAANGAGANFADVRIEISRTLGISLNGRPGLEFSLSLGVRAAVDGVWGFAGTNTMTLDNVASTARLAVAQAKAGRKLVPVPFEFATAPVVTGTNTPMWETLIERDPFTVPIGEQEALLIDANRYLQESVPALKKYKGRSGSSTVWLKSERLFASTEGSLITQRVYHGYPGAEVVAVAPNDYTNRFKSVVKELLSGGYGYEALSRANLKEKLREAAEQVIMRAANAAIQKSVDVGRYDIVLSSRTMCDVVFTTVAQALDIERAIGEKANAGGTTYAMPPIEVLGKYKLGSSLLNVSANRSRPHGGATVGWDEDGVEPDDFTLVKDGVIVDYITTRRTAPALSSWYNAKGVIPRSHGCTGGTGSNQPELLVPNLALKPGPDNTTADDLIRGVRKGLYIEYASGASDQQLMNNHFSLYRAREIFNGKLGAVVRDAAIQFNTSKFWTSLAALGGPSSSVTEEYNTGNNLSNVRTVAIESVPALVRDVNVVNTGKQG